jgi:nicotinamide-nucleotide amidase
MLRLSTRNTVFPFPWTHGHENTLVRHPVRFYNTTMSGEEKAARALIKHKKTIALAESCSGGLLGHRLTNVPGSSAFFLGGVMTYCNTAKINLLAIPTPILRRYGAVSAEVALAMAKGVRQLLRADIGLAITGIAGPSGGTKQKPVGLVYIAVVSRGKKVVTRNFFKGQRLTIKTQATTAALKLLLNFLSS